MPTDEHPRDAYMRLIDKMAEYGESMGLRFMQAPISLDRSGHEADVMQLVFMVPVEALAPPEVHEQAKFDEQFEALTKDPLFDDIAATLRDAEEEDVMAEAAAKALERRNRLAARAGTMDGEEDDGSPVADAG